MFVPHIGTFIQRDPLPQGAPILGYSDGAVIELRTKMTQQEASNLYGYVSNNPLTKVDPTGLIIVGDPKRCWKIYIVCIGAAEEGFRECLKYEPVEDCYDVFLQRTSKCKKDYEKCKEEYRWWNWFCSPIF